MTVSSPHYVLACHACSPTTSVPRDDCFLFAFYAYRNPFHQCSLTLHHLVFLDQEILGRLSDRHLLLQGSRLPSRIVICSCFVIGAFGVALGLRNSLVPGLVMNSLRDMGEDVEVDFGTEVVVGNTVVAAVPEGRRAGNHDWEPVGLVDHMRSSLVMEPVVEDERRNFFDIADLLGGLAFLQAFLQIGMVVAEEVDEVEDSNLEKFEDRHVMTVVLSIAVSKPATDVAVVRCQQAFDCSILLLP
jgi:hypothetical protein